MNHFLHCWLLPLYVISHRRVSCPTFCWEKTWVNSIPPCDTPMERLHSTLGPSYGSRKWHEDVVFHTCHRAGPRETAVTLPCWESCPSYAFGSGGWFNAEQSRQGYRLWLCSPCHQCRHSWRARKDSLSNSMKIKWSSSHSSTLMLF